MTTTIQINSIEIPDDFIQLACSWYNGSSSMLYAISSTGGLKTWNRRPSGTTDEEWYLNLWDQLDVELSHQCRLMQINLLKKADGYYDLEDLKRFQKFAEETADSLRISYGLE